MRSRPLCGSRWTIGTAHTPRPRGLCASLKHRTCFGGHSERETPGHIPNPEAKTLSADGTARETSWESRTPPDFFITERPPGRHVPGAFRISAPIPFAVLVLDGRWCRRSRCESALLTERTGRLHAGECCSAIRRTFPFPIERLRDVIARGSRSSASCASTSTCAAPADPVLTDYVFTAVLVHGDGFHLGRAAHAGRRHPAVVPRRPTGWRRTARTASRPRRGGAARIVTVSLGAPTGVPRPGRAADASTPRPPRPLRSPGPRAGPPAAGRPAPSCPRSRARTAAASRRG